MWIKTKINAGLMVFMVLLSPFLLLACSNATNAVAQGERQQDVEQLFKKAEELFDQDKPEEAYKLLKKLAEQGDAKSQNALGNGYEYGFWGEVDLKQAEYWYRKAANQNYVGGIHNLGMLEVLQGNYQQGLPYFEKAASLNSSESMTLLGAYYAEGILFEQDYKKALEYFYKAIEVDENNSSAQFNIGQAYYYGHGVQQDYTKALAWYVKSANQDYSLAKIQLAEMYFSGKGMGKDVNKAIEIITPLAELRDSKAEENLKWYKEHPD